MCIDSMAGIGSGTQKEQVVIAVFCEAVWVVACFLVVFARLVLSPAVPCPMAPPSAI